MSFISLVEKNNKSNQNIFEYDSVNSAIQDIVYKLLETNSELINDVEAGNSSKNILESKIIEIIDRERIRVKELKRTVN